CLGAALLQRKRGEIQATLWRLTNLVVAGQHVRCGPPQTDAGHATSRENTSGSTLPPDKTATATLPLTSILPLSNAASATAPPGSTTSLSSANANATAAATSSSLADTPAPTSERLMAKVSLPGMRAISASQMVPVSAAFASR